MNSSTITNQSHPHLTPRQRAREIAFQFLFQYDTVNAEQIDSPANVEKEFEKHVAHFSAPQESFDFALRLVRTTATSLKEIDKTISKHAENWRMERIGAIEKAFLRMGTAELLYFKEVPASVTLNEVVELSKLFGEEETPAFLNGILDPISQEPLALAGKVASE
jgi:N utilization substance protein B